MPPSFRPLLAAALLACLSAPAVAQQPIQPPAKYAAVVKDLRGWIADESRARGIPSVSVALVDGQDIVWAEAFGLADPQAKTPAATDTAYRVGFVSEPVLLLTVLRLVEQGKLDLDAPVTKYLPDFAPKNPFKKAITLRHLLTHSAGLVSEAPVGGYFTGGAAPLAKQIDSLNQTTLHSEPGTSTSMSNAGLAVAGHVVERVQKEPFAAAARRLLFDPLGMKSSEFALTPALRKKLASGQLWKVHGREFDAPVFETNSPGDGLFATAPDLARFLQLLLADGQVNGKPLLAAKTVERLLAPPGAKDAFPYQFFNFPLPGSKSLMHNGSSHGFTASLALRRADKLGAVVLAAKNQAFGWTRVVADMALEQWSAARQGKQPPPLARTQAPGDAAASWPAPTLPARRRSNCATGRGDCGSRTSPSARSPRCAARARTSWWAACRSRPVRCNKKTRT